MTEDVRAVALRMYEAFNARDLVAAETILSAGFVSHPLRTTGVESVVKSWARMHALFPDIQVIVEDMLIDGDRVAVRTTLRGIPSTVEEQSSPTMIEIFRIQEGRIAELWGVSTLRRPGR